MGSDVVQWVMSETQLDVLPSPIKTDQYNTPSFNSNCRVPAHTIVEITIL